ncbi:MAG: metallophosphoesterase family protein [Clostridia bacterium]|nr:metallophosphoesterase family protein [Clostridia bacterium]
MQHLRKGRRAAPVQIGVISDTHGLLRRGVVAELQDCSHILHAGDIIRETDLDELRLYGSLYAVRGNNDLWQDGLRDLAGVLRFTIAGVSFLMTHDRRSVPRNLEGVQAVIFGHTHQYSEEWLDGRLWLNPGSCGRARFGGEVSMAKLKVQDGKILKIQKICFSNQQE